jgi:hypothetical protein
MALNKTALKTTIVSLLTEMLLKEETSIEEFAARLSDAIDAFVKTGLVSVAVSTTGTATAQTGTGTGTIK